MVWRGTISIAVLLILFAFGFASHGKQNEIHYVGVPDGAAGVMVRYVTEEKVGGRAIRTIRFAPYHQFMARYAQAVREVQNREVLLDLLKTYVSDDITIGDVETWQKMNVHFTHPLNSRRRG